jgi:hypothetical protein
MNFNPKMGQGIPKVNAVKPFNRTTGLLQSLLSKGHRAAEGELVLFATLGTSGSYTFQVNENQNRLLTEIRLRQGDAFIPTHVGLYLANAPYAAPSDAQLAQVKKHTYPNTIVFGAAAGPLEAIYNSRLQIQVNSVNLTETLYTQRFKRVGIAQQGLNASQGTSAALAASVYQQSSWDNDMYGMCALSQSIAFNGVQNNVINLLLPAAVDATVGSNTNYAILVLKGIQVINGAGSVTDASISAFNR